MNSTHIINSTWSAFVAAVLAVLLILLSYFVLEPIVGRASTEVFTVTQEITAEISFSASTTDVTMSPSLSGVTGGYASGTAQALVLTNNATGYNMDIRFGTSTSHTVAKMLGATNGGYINDYSLAGAPTTSPDFTFSIGGAGTPGEFAYTVTASDSGDVDANFLDNGTNCGQAGGSMTTNRCWMTPSSTDYRIIDRSTATPDSSSTSTIQFLVAVPNSPNPALPNDFYTATVTLTASVNP